MRLLQNHDRAAAQNRSTAQTVARIRRPNQPLGVVIQLCHTNTKQRTVENNPALRKAALQAAQRVPHRTTVLLLTLAQCHRGTPVHHKAVQHLTRRVLQEELLHIEMQHTKVLHQVVDTGRKEEQLHNVDNMRELQTQHLPPARAVTIDQHRDNKVSFHRKDEPLMHHNVHKATENQDKVHMSQDNDRVTVLHRAQARREAATNALPNVKLAMLHAHRNGESQ